MKKILVLMTVAFLTLSVNAQNWGVGLKAGAWDYGLNIKKYQGSNNLEGVFDFHSNGFRALGLYEWTHKLGSGFQLYYGLGASLGLWDDADDEAGFGLAINGVLGIEWHLPDNIPFSLALDWTPGFELIPSSGFYGRGVAFSVKYVW